MDVLRRFQWLIAIMFPLVLEVSAQECGTLPPTPEQYAFTRDVVAHIDLSVRGGGTTCIPIQAHMVLTDAGTGGLSLKDLNIGLGFLNDLYHPAGIQFFWKGPPQYANNTDYYHYDRSPPDNDTEAELVSLFTEATDAVNVYLVQTMHNASGVSLNGYAYYPSSAASSNRVFMRNGAFINAPNGTFAHEFGHYFNLFHTHQGTEHGNSSDNAENVPRFGPDSNCMEKGDLLCDTEADPRYNNSQFHLASCSYTGSGNDINGVPYMPPVENVMSYYPDRCGGLFTPEQYMRLQQGLVMRLEQTSYTLDAAPMQVAPPAGLTATWNDDRVLLSWSDVADNETGYLVERSTTSATEGFRALSYAATAPDVTTLEDTLLQSNTTYWYRLKPSNGACDSFGEVTPVSVGIVYCFPAYFSACTNTYIRHFAITDGVPALDNFSGNCSPGNYGDFLAMNAGLTAGQPHSFMVIGNTTSARLQIYVDLDQNGSLDDPGEQLLDTPGTAPWNGMITLPATALNGSTRLRVRMWDNFNGCDVTPCGYCQFGETEDYTVTISGGVDPILQVSPKAFLAGAYDEATGMMRDDLRSQGLIPVVEPYSDMAFTLVPPGGGHMIEASVLGTTGNEAIVDWVIVELRDKVDNTIIHAARPALIRRDGGIVDLDGASPVNIAAPVDHYHVAVRHRNHLGVMTDAAIPLDHSNTTIDLTSPATTVHGTEARRELDGVMLLWCGNTRADGVLKYTGSENDRDPLLVRIGGSVPTNVATGYHPEDTNMDGVVRYTGAENDRDRIFMNVGGEIPTMVRHEQLP